MFFTAFAFVKILVTLLFDFIIYTHVRIFYADIRSFTPFLFIIELNRERESETERERETGEDTDIGLLVTSSNFADRTTFQLRPQSLDNRTLHNKTRKDPRIKVVKEW